MRQEAITIDPQLRLLKTGSRAPRRAPARQSRVRQRTGCSVVAVERGDDLIVEFGAEFRFQPDDQVYICGTNAATLDFVSQYG